MTKIDIHAQSRLGMGCFGLRKLELDSRRELGIIVGETAIAKRMQEVFEADWQQTLTKAEVKVAAAEKSEKGDKDEKAATSA